MLAMAFTKGHPYYPPVDGIPPGKRRGDVLAAKSLAAVLRAGVGNDEILRVLRSIAIDGRDPSAPEGQAYAPPEWPVRLAALKMLLERRNGTPTDEATLDDQLKRLAREAGESDRGSVRKLSEVELAAYRALQRKTRGLPALAPPTTPTGATAPASDTSSAPATATVLPSGHNGTQG